MDDYDMDDPFIDDSEFAVIDDVPMPENHHPGFFVYYGLLETYKPPSTSSAKHPKDPYVCLCCLPCYPFFLTLSRLNDMCRSSSDAFQPSKPAAKPRTKAGIKRTANKSSAQGSSTHQTKITSAFAKLSAHQGSPKK